ncbi:ABC transporter ATP-binding protein [Pseudonocardia sp. NPDC049635]|uniref:ABC transporter ATP-binding protein n=1 Tax=Pseudonocardia sp. NPDC049635 TaxID=3155506 RepID=UPI0033C2C253
MAALLEVTDLSVRFKRTLGVDGVSLDVAAGETVGLVGESGSGKSTIGRAVLGLVPPSEGSIRFAGQEIGHASRRTRRALAHELQVVFQDPHSSLDPRMTVGATVREGLPPDRRTDEHVAALLQSVGLPADARHRYPHQFSGGQRQRIAIARAIGPDPKLVVCDEPISALDLSTQAAILNLFAELQDRTGVALLFVAHDLVAVEHLSDRIVVLYRGRVMEAGPAAEICAGPLHPYTQALWAAAPVVDPEEQRRRRTARAAAGVVSASAAPPTAQSSNGCPFAPRCPVAEPVCHTVRPAEEQVGHRRVACHLLAADRRAA